MRRFVPCAVLLAAAPALAQPGLEIRPSGSSNWSYETSDLDFFFDGVGENVSESGPLFSKAGTDGGILDERAAMFSKTVATATLIPQPDGVWDYEIVAETDAIVEALDPTVTLASSDSGADVAVLLQADRDYTVVVGSPSIVELFGNASGNLTWRVWVGHPDNQGPGFIPTPGFAVPVFAGDVLQLGGRAESFVEVEPPGETLESARLEALYPATLTPACFHDLNGDGILDQGDITAFITLFLAQNLFVDYNRDNLIDNGDVTEFIQRFLGGCAE